MSELTISIPTALEHWVASRVSERGYADAAEYVRDLLRRDQEQGEDDLAHLRALIDEGLASGIIDAEPEVVLDQIIAERRARYG
jgi:antitoxin ParD1/3/4